MFRHFAHFLVFVVVIGFSLTMVSNLFKSKYDKDVFITGSAPTGVNKGFDSTHADYTGTCADCCIRHK